ncbi:thiosulfate dehydrogenase [quinone] large subunit [Mucilaginibacter frigoritolerans]|uniref:Thiosulfate dehydrogenase [quinone] large subunit n=1 Tax=Mucilaginibacter frigoritolerans TaxID=652788 RepID=A0A562U964_9SPHI|nr:DoxX family protein [Mucilaginibacter frigoritolerans]TWJ02288.1 thiosulfate dehydrogenase [quinone] large subunit [Mucilaginibacter frigoritolerans]
MKRKEYAYLLARLPMGMSFFGHGLIRLTKLDAFSHGIVGQFSKSLLPAGLVLGFGYALPFLEFITGFLLLLGWFTRFAIILGVVIMLSLILGSSLIEQWNAVFTQIVYSAYLAILFYFADSDGISIDGYRRLI